MLLGRNVVFMASWMVHLRIADLLMREFSYVEKTEFVVGNIAPDSGIPSVDWSYYMPPKNVSHFWDEEKHIKLESYIEKYYTWEKRKGYSKKEDSFYLGYLTHLMTDMLWVDKIVIPCNQLHRREKEENKTKYIWDVKADWYDLDFVYLSKYPDFNAYQIFKNAVGFRNTYLDIFAEDAFDNRREYIVGFYGEKRENLEREYPYLNEGQMDKFVETAAETVAGWVASIK